MKKNAKNINKKYYQKKIITESHLNDFPLNEKQQCKNGNRMAALGHSTENHFTLKKNNNIRIKK